MGDHVIGMNDRLTQLKSRIDHTNSRAVSPVIGVILMVSITVILAAVVGIFVLGFSDQLGERSPQATIGLDDGEEPGSFSITHRAGDPLHLEDEFSVIWDGNTVDQEDVDWGVSALKAGESTEVNITEESGDFGAPAHIQLRHEPSNSIVANGNVTLGDE